MSPRLIRLAAIFKVFLVSFAGSLGEPKSLKVPIYFEPNHGQAPKEAEFVARGLGYQMSISRDGALLQLHGQKESESLRISLLGASNRAKLIAESPQEARVNYFFGRNRIEDVNTYGKIRVQEVYGMADLVYYGNGRELEYDFVVAPGGQVQAIQLQFDGARRLSVDVQGNLRLEMEYGELLQKRPIAYQFSGQTRTPVECEFKLDGNRVSFAVGTYDPTRPLVIDPVLVYSTYFGSSAYDSVAAMAVDPSGNTYLTGSTRSVGDFPLKNAYLDHNSSRIKEGNVFVMRISPGGGLVYATFLGGEDEDDGFGIAVDNASNAYITGRTRSSPRGVAEGFPYTEGAVQTDFTVGSDAVFVTKLSAGGGLVYSTFMMGDESSGGGASRGPGSRLMDWE